MKNELKNNTMNSANIVKKSERKLKKSQHVIFKETGIACNLTPTRNIVITNAGLVNGLSEEIVFEHFSKYGLLENIILVPGKSCSFVSYKDLNAAHEAFENYNGKLHIAQDNKPIYLLYTEELPHVISHNIWDEKPPGLTIIEDFVTEEKERDLLNLCDLQTSSDNTGQMKHRQVKHYGYAFLYDINNINKDNPLEDGIPSQCNFLWSRLLEKTNTLFSPNQLTVNYYNPGQGIPHHIDTHSAFEDPIISLSLQSSIVMDFRKDGKHLSILLPRRSLAIISGESRYEWTHGITPRKFDVVRCQSGYTSLQRGVRVSFTFRKILEGKCNCNNKIKCDSYTLNLIEPEIEDSNALQLETEYVHNVYENIAAHFSDTRHKPWPNVEEFVRAFDTGSILVDIGCGNGKYLGRNKNIFNVGFDRSLELINICLERGLEAGTADCLHIPLKDNIADGVISIAVIHHLANESRRLRAIQEIIRILKIEGLALIYVWAKDQNKNKTKTTYIKQDRKNRKNNDLTERDQGCKEVTVAEGISLPVHTNRTQFKYKDLLVPWKLKNDCETNTFLRFYHVFEEKELNILCAQLNNVDIVKSFYDEGNWCVVIKKIK